MAVLRNTYTQDEKGQRQYELALAKEKNKVTPAPVVATAPSVKTPLTSEQMLASGNGVTGKPLTDVQKASLQYQADQLSGKVTKAEVQQNKATSSGPIIEVLRNHQREAAMAKKIGMTPKDQTEFEMMMKATYSPSELAAMGFQETQMAGLTGQQSPGGQSSPPAFDPAQLKALGMSDEQIAAVQRVGSQANAAQSNLDATPKPTNSMLGVLQEALNAKKNVTNQPLGTSKLFEKAGVSGYAALAQSLGQRSAEMRDRYNSFARTVTDTAGGMTDIYNSALEGYKTTMDQYDKMVDRFMEMNQEARQQEERLQLMREEDQLSRKRMELEAQIKQSDPIYRAQLMREKAEAMIADKKAQGIPITAEDRASEAEAIQKIAYYNGGIGGSDFAYIPNSSLEGLQVTTENGEFNVICPPDKEFQCGAFVNRTWGTKVFGSKGVEKQSIVDKSGFNTKGKSDEQLSSLVKPGMAFYLPIANNEYDHVGLVKTVLPDGIIALEANANGKAKTDSVGPGKTNVTSDRFIPFSQIYGFVPPPDNKTQIVGKNAATFKDYMNEAKAKGLSYEAAKQYAEQKSLQDLESKESNGKSTITENDIRQIRKEAYALPATKTIGDITQKSDELNRAFNAYKNGKVNKNTVDQTLIVMFNKMLDPGSVVKEGEYARTAAGQDTLSAATEYLTKLTQGGAGITDKTREDMITMAEEFRQASQARFNQEAQFYVDEAKRMGIEPERFLGSYYQYYKPENFKGSAPEGKGTYMPGAKTGLAGMLQQNLVKVSPQTSPTLSKFGVGADLDSLIDF